MFRMFGPFEKNCIMHSIQFIHVYFATLIDCIFLQPPLIPRQKMRAAFILPAIGCSITFLIICAHFDNKYFPDIWREIFKDGSRSELYIICAMVAFWIAGLYICTGIHSVGYVQANVFFSSWAAFATSLMTLKLWRESAGLPSMFGKLVTHSRMTSEYADKLYIICICCVSSFKIFLITMPMRVHSALYSLVLLYIARTYNDHDPLTLIIMSHLTTTIFCTCTMLIPTWFE